MVLGIQILGVCFAIIILYITFLHWKRREFTVREYIFWLLLAVSFGLVSLFPGWLNPIVTSLNISRTMDFFIILGFMFLIGIVFYMYMVLRATQRKIDRIVRKIAINKAK